jgi:uncharacterized metal-binding protein
MPSGRIHKLINFILWFICLYYLIAHKLETPAWITLFTVSMYVFTVHINPDLDTDSGANRELGFVGKILRKVFTHRGILHSPVLWTVLFVPLCFFVGTWVIGGWLSVISHITADRIVTDAKRDVRKVNPF